MKTIKRPKQKYNLVEVIWDDATSLSQGWKEREDFDKEEIKPEIVLSVGFLVKQSDDYLILAMDTDGDGDHASRSQIPMGMVRKLKIIRKADKNGPSKATTTTSAGRDRFITPTGEFPNGRQDEPHGDELRPERPIKRNAGQT